MKKWFRKLYEFSIDELLKKSQGYRLIFYGYSIMAIVVLSIFFYTGLQSIQNIQTYTGLLYVLMLNLIFTSLVFGLMIFNWFISETNYYKMLQLHCDLMIYLKEKEEKEKRFA